MYVKSLELTDLRSYASASLEFTRGINLIVGHNNSGKSSIIKALYMLQNSNSLVKSDIRIKRTFTEIKVELDNISLKAGDQYFTGANNLLDGVERCQVKYKLSKEQLTKKFSQILHNQQHVERDFPDLPSTESKNNFIYPFLSKRKITNYSTSLTAGIAHAVMDTFQNLAIKVQKVSSQPKTKDIYEGLCRDILGFLVTNITTDNALSLGIYSGYGDVIPIESMGDGVANVVGLLSILLTEDNKLYLIEELENDLHPAALKKLLHLILFESRNNQFIISTHSNIVVKYLASDKNTRIFETDWQASDGHNEDIPTSTVSLIDNSTQERLRLLENLGYEPFDFEMFNGYLILEESTAERLIRDILIPMFLPEASGILRTVAARGVSGLMEKFDDLKRLFLYLHLSPIYENKAWVIADGDKAGADCVEALKLSYPTWPSSHFACWSKPAFEEYYPAPFQERATQIADMRRSKEKQQAKADLLNDVIKWIEMDRDAAKPLLAESASEVISKLMEIIEILR